VRSSADFPTSSTTTRCSATTTSSSWPSGTAEEIRKAGRNDVCEPADVLVGSFYMDAGLPLLLADLARPSGLRAATDPSFRGTAPCGAGECRDRPGPWRGTNRLSVKSPTEVRSLLPSIRSHPRRWRLCRLRRPSSRSWSRGRAKDVIPARFGHRRRICVAGPPGRICCSASSRSMHSAAPGVAAGCGSYRRSRALKWRAGSWSVSTCLRGLRRRAHPQMRHPPKGPGCTAPRRQPITPGAIGTPVRTSTSTNRCQAMVCSEATADPPRRVVGRAAVGSARAFRLARSRDDEPAGQMVAARHRVPSQA